MPDKHGRRDGAARQLALGFANPAPRYRREDFCLAESNAAAAQAAFGFADSPDLALAICGPEGAGKSHLAQIVADAAGVARRSGQEIEAAIADAGALAVVDDVDAIADPKRLFALIEHRRARGLKLVLAGRGRPADWARGLRDLATRLEAMTRASLDEPDEALMRIVIDQRFRDRQWRATNGVSAYAAPRLPRTFAAAEAFVEAAGAEAIAIGGAINLAVARKVIGKLSESETGH